MEWKLPNFKPPQLMTKSEAFQTANDILEIGKSEDSAYRYENALIAYKAALDYFMKALQGEHYYIVNKVKEFMCIAYR